MKHASLPLVYSFCAKLNSKVKETITLIQASLGMWKQLPSTYIHHYVKLINFLFWYNFYHRKSAPFFPCHSITINRCTYFEKYMEYRCLDICSLYNINIIKKDPDAARKNALLYYTTLQFLVGFGFCLFLILRSRNILDR